MTDKNVGRDDIVRNLTHIASYLIGKAAQKHCIHQRKINCLRTAVYSYSVALRGLKDQDLDEIAARLDLLEEKFERGEKWIEQNR